MNKSETEYLWPKMDETEPSQLTLLAQILEDRALVLSHSVIEEKRIQGGALAEIAKALRDVDEC